MNFLWYIFFLPIKVVNSSIMSSNIHAMPWLPNMQDQKLLMLRWRWFSECGREHFAVAFAPKDCHYLINGCLQPIRTYITQDAKLKVNDAPLQLILRMRQWLCCCLFCLQMPPIHRLCITATKLPFNYCTYKTRNCWRSVDAHFQNLAVTVSLSLLPIMAANMMIMHNSKQITTKLPYLQDQKLLRLCRRLFYVVVALSLTILPTKAASTTSMGQYCSIAVGLCKMQHHKSLIFRWRSFSERGSDCVVFCFAYKGCQYVGYA